ncbi:hypothetical protein PTTG_07617 [Puccinia triticina 1-1 BBBD Race 1]|uniref:Phosphatidylglycerol/phosphatidylinositol transfer protein n=2 Tax=Puccinia triticina TaxID=208348 RepID=A0A0C4F3D8_PUCT1|nr:uncharacterized protein PtA15_7A374 [Puccinia triticina]OAV88147.1 hypothetical protein PTTG_07617 [Puccinia triticina 1-1 BBBD Race 1]WAQ86647.1 hypothetical protein PtA15_7A374 [Puccinia triticina]WAR56509.1 hypothetical protein PtB15_7B358 [Puccinia triticina]
MWFSAIITALILTSVTHITLIWAADSIDPHRITVINKCKDEFSMRIPGRGIFSSEAGNVKLTYIIYGDFKNVTGAAAVGNLADCGLFENTAKGPCTTAVFSLNNFSSTAHIDLVPPHKYNYPLRMKMTNRASQVECGSANCTTAVRKNGSISKGQEIQDPAELTGIILEFCY